MSESESKKRPRDEGGDEKKSGLKKRRVRSRSGKEYLARNRKPPTAEEEAEAWERFVPTEKMENEAFFAYYKTQKIIPEEEWNAFVKALQTELPVTFRLSPVSGFTDALRSRLESHYYFTKNAIELAEREQERKKADKPKAKEKEQEAATTAAAGAAPGESKEAKGEEGAFVAPAEAGFIEYEGKRSPLPTPLPWYPNKLAWYIPADKKALRKCRGLAGFRHFLQAETEQGTLTRQEAVSMIPPLLLDVQPGHTVIDMCAAPGSKTGQILEALQAPGVDVKKIESGLVIANDADARRAHMLTHQLKRLGSHLFVVTTHEGQAFPNVYRRVGSDGSRTEVIKFDRVLCDVPCTGDGTLRKSPSIWASWKPSMGHAMHPLQLSIAQRAVRLLKAGGLMVYSTCSLNPIENEAVVAELLRQFRGQLELVDASAMLPELKRMPGLSTWRVWDADDRYFNSYEDVPQERRKQVKPSFFPPSEQEAKELNLHRCWRLAPHHQDTGGFFIALLRKTGGDKEKEQKGMDTSADAEAPAAATSTAAAPASEDGKEGKEEQQAKKAKAKKENTPKPFDIMFDPYLPISADIRENLRSFFGLQDTFAWDCLYQRSTETAGSRRIYYLSPRIADVLMCPRNERLKVVNTGLRLFDRSGSGELRDRFRVAQEGLELVVPHMTKQLVVVPISTFIRIVRDRLTFINTLEQPLREQVQAAQSGCLVVQLAPEFASKFASKRVIGVTTWKSDHTINLQVNKDDQLSLLSMLMLEYPEAEEAFKNAVTAIKPKAGGN